MSDPLTIVILLAAGESSEALTLATASAIRRALGQTTHVEVVEIAGPPTDVEALSVEERTRAQAAVELTWSDSAHREATLRAHDARTGAWIDRWIRFDSAGADVELGRTLGFATASMLSEPSFPPDPTQPVAPPEQAVPSMPAQTEEPVRVRFGLEGFALGATGVGGEMGSAGAGAGARLFVGESASIRLALSAREGTANSPQSSSFALVTSASVALQALRATESRPFGLSVRLDGLLVREWPTGRSRGVLSPADTGWLPGVGVFVEGSLRAAPKLETIGALGLEEVFGSVHGDASTDSTRATALLPPRAAVELGLRWRP